MKRHSITILFLVLLALGATGAIAHAQSGPPVPDDGTSFLALLMTGKYLAGVGAFLVLFVQAVKKLGADWFGIAWFRTKAGGLVLGFGSAVLLYLGAALEAGQAVTFGLFAAALGAGWAAAGGWEHISDLLAWLRPPSKGSQIPVAQAVSTTPQPSNTIIHTAIILASATACLTIGATLVQACGPAKTAGAVVVNCTEANAQKIDALVDEFKVMFRGNPVNWDTVESKAIAAGETIGGCALAVAVQDFLSATKAPLVEDGWGARDALEHTRAHFGGNIVWHTAKGEL